MFHQSLIELAQERFKNLPADKNVLLLHTQFPYHNLLIDALLSVSTRSVLYLGLAAAKGSLSGLWTAISEELAQVYGITLPALENSRPQNAARQFAQAVAPLLPLLVVVNDYDSALTEVHHFVAAVSQQLGSNIQFLISGRNWPEALLDALPDRDQAAVLPVAPDYMLLDYLQRDNDRVLLEVRALGYGQVLINGRHIAQWDGSLPRSLFFFFVDRGMTTRDEVFETFWPELSTREATNVFHVTKRKISEILDMDLTVYSSGFYRISPQIDLHYDVISFVQAVQESAVSTPDVALELLEQALVLCNREFLGDFDQPWALRRREELVMVKSDALTELARLHEADGTQEEAIGFYSRAFGAYPRQEELARKLIDYYLAQNQPQQAQRVFLLLEHELRTAWADEPSPEMIALAEQIQRLL